MKVLVTGSSGFVGRWMVRYLKGAGHEVWGTVFAGDEPVDPPDGVRLIPMDITDRASVQAALIEPYDAVVHLAALASGGACRHDPAHAWTANAVGTALVANSVADVAEQSGRDTVFLLASSPEVYGAVSGGPRLRVETDAIAPCSPYGSSKAAAELAALEVGRRTGLRVIVARSFLHTGPGQSAQYVIPAFTDRLLTAKQIGAPVVKVGRLDITRDFLDVRDVVVAYARLLEHGRPGEAYNVCRGEGRSLRDVFDRLTDIVGHPSIPEVDPDLVRTGEIEHLVGDGSKLEACTGWTPTIPFDQTLTDIVDAQAH